MGSLSSGSYRDIEEIKNLIDVVSDQYGRMLEARVFAKQGPSNPSMQTALNTAVAALDKLQLRAKGLQNTAREVSSRIERDLKSFGGRR